jgi:signal recognition particle receptor subunit beta
LQLDFHARELTIKLVYYGPALSGKTTNLHAIHGLVAADAVGKLMSLETRDDRTLFFDLLPLTVDTEAGLKVRIKLFTVPGQVIHNATRRLVLQGADGIVFVADSRKSETKPNQESFLNMQENLRDTGIDPNRLPLVIQFNKRDLPDIRSDEEIDRMRARGKEPVFKAIATRGVGVLETLLGLFQTTWGQIEKEHSFRSKFGIDPDIVYGEVSRKVGMSPAREKVLR